VNHQNAGEEKRNRETKDAGGEGGRMEDTAGGPSFQTSRTGRRRINFDQRSNYQRSQIGQKWGDTQQVGGQVKPSAKKTNDFALKNR